MIKYFLNYFSRLKATSNKALAVRQPIYKKTNTKCGVSCWKAHSIDCSCSCAGANHGKYWKLRKAGIMLIEKPK